MNDSQAPNGRITQRAPTVKQPQPVLDPQSAREPPSASKLVEKHWGPISRTVGSLGMFTAQNMAFGSKPPAIDSPTFGVHREPA